MNSHIDYASPEFQDRINTLLDLNVTSFAELAVLSPDLWRHFSNPDDRRRAARLLGWPTVCVPDAFEQMSLMDFVAVFLNTGDPTAEKLWQRHPKACEYLRRTRRLGSVLHLLGLDQMPTAQAEGLEFFLARCREAGCFDLWRDVDFTIYRQALRLGFAEAISAQVPHRPAGGYPTAGGSVFRTDQLIVARLLEIAGVSFQVSMNLHAGYQMPGWSWYAIEFVLSEPARYLIIASGVSPETAYRDRRRGQWLRWLCRRDADLRKRKLNGEVVRLDGRVLNSTGGLTAFVSHVHFRLSQAGIIPANLLFDPQQCLCFDTAREPFSHDDRGG